jgi:hypothetical protein
MIGPRAKSIAFSLGRTVFHETKFIARRVNLPAPNADVAAGGDRRNAVFKSRF